MVMEAKENGFDEAIALDVAGYVSEGPGENIFLVWRNVIYTPPLGSSMLMGITRDCAITLAKEMGYEVREQVIPREMLYVADEVFFTGTAAEVRPSARWTASGGPRPPWAGDQADQEEFFGITDGSRPTVTGGSPWSTRLTVGMIFGGAAMYCPLVQIPAGRDESWPHPADAGGGRKGDLGEFRVRAGTVITVHDTPRNRWATSSVGKWP